MVREPWRFCARKCLAALGKGQTRSAVLLAWLQLLEAPSWLGAREPCPGQRTLAMAASIHLLVALDLPLRHQESLLARAAAPLAEARALECLELGLGCFPRG